MNRILTTICILLSLVATLAAVPVTASAANSPLIVENGVAVPIGTKILTTNIGTLKFTTSIGTMECTTAKMTGELTKNTTGTVESSITAVEVGGTGLKQVGAPAAECTTQPIFGGDTSVTMNPTTNGLPWCLRSTSAMADDEFQLRGNSCANLARPIRFAMDITNIGTCVYQRTGAIPGVFTTSTTDSALVLSEVEVPKLEGSFGCPSSGKLDMTVTLETDASPSTPLGVTS